MVRITLFLFAICWSIDHQFSFSLLSSKLLTDIEVLQFVNYTFYQKALTILVKVLPTN